MHVNMEEEEKQRMEDFVRGLFSKTEDFNLLTKKIVRKKYLQHSRKESLNTEEKSIFADIIVKLLFEFNVGTEESAKRNAKNCVIPPVAEEEKSEAGKVNSPDGLSRNAQETRPKSLLLSKIDPCLKVEDETSLDACATENVRSGKEEEERKDVESVKKKPELFEKAKKLAIQDTNERRKRLLFSLQPTKTVLSRQILINNFRDKVKKTSPSKFILNESSSPSHVLSVTTVSKSPSITDGSQKLTNDKDVKVAQGKAGSFNGHSVEKQHKVTSKRLSAFEVLQSVLEDSNDGSVLSKSDFTDDDRTSGVRSSPACDSLADKEDTLIPLDEISDSTPTRRRFASKRLLESDDESTEGFTPPTKIKRIISSDSDSKNSPIRMRLFRNRIVDYSLRVPNTTEKRKSVIESDSESQSPFKALQASDLSTADSSPAPLKVKVSIRQKHKDSEYENCTKAEKYKERKIVKPFRISISKREILKASDSESDIEISPVIKETKNKPKRKKKSSKHKTNANHFTSSSSSCDTDDLKLSQIKSMSQNQQGNSSDSDGELLINYTSSRFRSQSNNFKVPTVQKNSIAVDGLQPKLRIIHEKSAMDSDSDYSAKKLNSSPLKSSVGKLRIIRENVVSLENDHTASANMHICDTAPLSSPDKTPQKVRRKIPPLSVQPLNSDSDSDLGLKIILSTSSDSEDVPLSKKKKVAQTSLQSVSKSSGMSATGGEQDTAAGNEQCSRKVSSLTNSPLSSSEFGGSSWTSGKKDMIDAAVACIRNINDTKVSKQQDRQVSGTNEYTSVDAEDSNDESDNGKTNINKNTVYSEDENFVQNWKSKQLVIRLERIQAASSVIVRPNTSNESLILTTSSCRTITSGDNAEETHHPDVDCNGISSDTDISSLSDSALNDCHAPSITNHVIEEKAEFKNVPVESDKLKHLKKICRAAELFVNYKKEFQDLESDSAKCQRLQQILKNAGMKGRPTFKAAERIRLLREAKELNEENIISCDSGRPRRKIQDLFTVKTSKNVTDPKPEKFVNLVGIVDSEGSESDVEFN